MGGPTVEELLLRINREVAAGNALLIKDDIDISVRLSAVTSSDSEWTVMAQNPYTEFMNYVTGEKGDIYLYLSEKAPKKVRFINHDGGAKYVYIAVGDLSQQVTGRMVSACASESDSCDHLILLTSQATALSVDPPLLDNRRIRIVDEKQNTQVFYIFFLEEEVWNQLTTLPSITAPPTPKGVVLCGKC